CPTPHPKTSTKGYLQPPRVDRTPSALIVLRTSWSVVSRLCEMSMPLIGNFNQTSDVCRPVHRSREELGLFFARPWVDFFKTRISKSLKTTRLIFCMLPFLLPTVISYFWISIGSQRLRRRVHASPRLVSPCQSQGCSRKRKMKLINSFVNWSQAG